MLLFLQNLGRGVFAPPPPSPNGPGDCNGSVSSHLYCVHTRLIFLEKITHTLFDNFFGGKKQSELSREPNSSFPGWTAKKVDFKS